MSHETVKTALQEQTQRLLDGPLKHVRVAALAAALLPLASIAATPASARPPRSARPAVRVWHRVHGREWQRHSRRRRHTD